MTGQGEYGQGSGGLLLGLGLTNNHVKILGGILAQIEWKLKNL